ncbi:hypothetical protein [Bradyrhizobium sp. BR 1432]|uniref:hypothetical protein n=1 Tax=Bradyrhizobium sp. BR 1432 TaxID=3447966 RepID=UPI003EE6FEB9
MSENKFAIPRVDDASLIAVFRQLRDDFQPQTCGLNVVGIDRIDWRKDSVVVDGLARSSSYVVSSVSAEFPQFSIRYDRNRDASLLSPYFDELTFRYENNNNQPSLKAEQRLEIVHFINSKLSHLGGVAGSLDTSGHSVVDLQSIYHGTILKLETSFADQIRKITDWTVEQTSQLEQHKLKLTEETDNERKVLRDEYDRQIQELRQKEEDLELRRKALDDRDYVHARRARHTALREIIERRQTNFTLTGDTRKLRTPIHVAMILLLFALTAANVLNVQILLPIVQRGEIGLPFAWAIAKQTVLTAAFLGAILFYIRWMNRWFEQHASAEFLLKQFELDVDRASWVVETAMEWRRDQNEELPTALLDGITRNLFSGPNSLTEVHSAADNLASALVGNASQLKLKIGENELNLNRKGVAGLAKTPS